MSLKNKILLLGLLPLLLFIAAGLYIANDSYGTFANGRLVYKNMEFTKVASKLIHETQKERGASGAYLNGGITLEKLSSQRTLTDKFQIEALEVLKKVEFESSYIDTLRTELNKYAQLREDISSKRIKGSESVRRYREIISVLTSYNAKIANLSVFGDVSAANKTLQSLEIVKEYAGVLRAVSAGVIARDKPLKAQEIDKIQRLMQGVDISINSEALTFSKEAKKLKSEFLDSEEWESTVTSYYIVLAKKSTGKFGIKSSEYLDTITTAINKLDKLIKFQLSETMNVTDKKRLASQTKIVFLGCLLGALSLVVTFIILKVSKELISNLTNISEKMTKGITDISSLANEIANSSQSLASSSEQQSSSMQETSSSMSEVEAMIQRNTKDAENSNEIAMDSYNGLKDAVGKIKDMTSSINNIRGGNDRVAKQVSVSNEKMSEIANIIKGIGEKTQVINDIVFQTKLLSFNASVEAARAGEHGKGFAVVAEEVGNLAQMSGKASEEIYVMLESSITSVEKAVQEQQREMDSLVSESKNNIEKGVQLGEESEGFLENLLGQMDTLKESVGQISLASNEQLKGVNEVTSAVEQVNDATRTNSAIATDSSRISEDLNHNLEDFSAMVSSLEFLISAKEQVADNESSHRDDGHEERVPSFEEFDDVA